MSELWTSEVPTTDGFYWWKCEPEYKPEVVQLHNGIVLVTGSGAKFPTSHFAYQQWGPMIPDDCKLNAMVHQSRSLLVMLMESYSEDHYSAGWLNGIEYILWDRIKQPLDETITEQDADEYLIAVASRVTSGWAVYGEHGPKWIPMPEWEAILAKRKEVNSE